MAGSQIGSAGSPIDPRLGPLSNIGGSTNTHALLPGSPAINTGDPAAIPGSNGISQFDQRGATGHASWGAAWILVRLSRSQICFLATTTSTASSTRLILFYGGNSKRRRPICVPTAAAMELSTRLITTHGESISAMRRRPRLQRAMSTWRATSPLLLSEPSTSLHPVPQSSPEKPLIVFDPNAVGRPSIGLQSHVSLQEELLTDSAWAIGTNELLEAWLEYRSADNDGEKSVVVRADTNGTDVGDANQLCFDDVDLAFEPLSIKVL